MPKKIKRANDGLYIASEKYREVTYIEEGFEDDSTQVTVTIRRHLLNHELESLNAEPLPVFLKDEDGNDLEGDALAEGQRRLQEALEEREAEVREAMAPFVVDWNMGYLTPSGERVKADPPAVAGGEQFGRFLSDRIVAQIYRDLRFHSLGLVKAKSSTPPAPTVEPIAGESSTPTGTEAE